MCRLLTVLCRFVLPLKMNLARETAIMMRIDMIERTMIQNKLLKICQPKSFKILRRRT